MSLRILTADTQARRQPFRKNHAGFHMPICFLRIEIILKGHFIERSVPWPVYYQT